MTDSLFWRLRRIPAITPSRPPGEGDASAPYFNAVDRCQLAALGRHLLRDQSVHGLGHSRGGGVKRLPAPRLALPVGNAHRFVGIDNKDRHELHTIGAGDAVVTACLGI